MVLCGRGPGSRQHDAWRVPQPWRERGSELLDELHGQHARGDQPPEGRYAAGHSEGLLPRTSRRERVDLLHAPQSGVHDAEFRRAPVGGECHHRGSDEHGHEHCIHGYQLVPDRELQDQRSGSAGGVWPEGPVCAEPSCLVPDTGDQDQGGAGRRTQDRLGSHGEQFLQRRRVRLVEGQVHGLQAVRPKPGDLQRPLGRVADTAHAHRNVLA